MGCTNQKLQAQQIAYQRDFLGACWNSPLGEEEAEEYLASRWMGLSKDVMALYTNNHCFTVRTLNKDEKARSDAAAAGKPAVRAPDDPSGVSPGFGGDLGAGGGQVQTPCPSLSPAESPTFFADRRLSTYGPQSNSPFAVTPDQRLSREPSGLNKGQQAGKAADEREHASGGANGSSAGPSSTIGGNGRSTSAERIKKSADAATMRNVVKEAIESDRVLHSEHPYLQRHALSVYGGVVFRCAPARRLYHRISLVPEASMKRLYDMQVTAMSRSVIGDASSLMRTHGSTHGGIAAGGIAATTAAAANGGGGEGGEGGSSTNEPTRFLHSLDGEDHAVLSHGPPARSGSHAPSMVPSPLVRPLSDPGPHNMEGGVIYTNLPLLGSARDPPLSLPMLPLAAVPARHLRFASCPELQQSAVIDAWAAESPLSGFNNYTAVDRDVAGVTATQPPIIVGSVTAMELLALPPNAEVCFGGWLYVSLQDEQQRLRKSLHRYAARQKRRRAKAAAAAREATRFSGLSPSLQASHHPTQRNSGAEWKRSAAGFEATGGDVEKGAANVGGHASTARTATTSGVTSSPPGMPIFRDETEQADPASGGELQDSAPGLQEEPSSVRSQDVQARSLDNTAVFAKTWSSEAFPHGATPSSPTVLAAVAAATAAAGAQGVTSPLTAAATHAMAASLPASPLHARSQPSPFATADRTGANRRATVAGTREGVEPARTPSRLRGRASSMPPSPMIGPVMNPVPQPPPVLHTGRYAREAMEADTLTASWLPYAYVVVAVPMYECSLVPTTFHTAFTRHKAVSLNLSSAQSRQAYGVGCITGVRYGGVMVIEYREKVDDVEDADWVAELIRVARMAQREAANGEANDDHDGDDDDDMDAFSRRSNPDMPYSDWVRRYQHSATHRARAEKLRRIKSRIWNKLRRHGLHVILAATRMSDRRHRQQRASAAAERNGMFASSQADAVGSGLGITPLQPGTRRSASNIPAMAASATSAAGAALSSTTLRNGNPDRGPASRPRNSLAEPVAWERRGGAGGAVGASYANNDDGAGGGAEELNEAMEDIADDIDSATSTGSSRTRSDKDDDDDDEDENEDGRESEEGDGDNGTFSRPSPGSLRHGGGRRWAGRDSSSSSSSRSTSSSSAVSGSTRRGDAQSTRRQWWRSASRRQHHGKHRDSENQLGLRDGRHGHHQHKRHHAHKHHHHHHHHRHHHHRKGVTTREDRLRWTDPRMADDFYLRGTFRQIGGMKYLDVVSLMDGCPVSELVQGIRRWATNLLAMPIKARPICLYLQRYEGIAASLRLMQTQLTATALASNVASGKQLAQANFSFHMHPSGPPRHDMNWGNDETNASFAAQPTAEALMDPLGSSALINASFTAMQAPAQSTATTTTRILAYHTYYCGPLEPDVRAVLAPEIESMIAACTTRQLPDVLRSPDLMADTAPDGSHHTGDHLSPSHCELGPAKQSTLTHVTGTTVFSSNGGLGSGVSPTSQTGAKLSADPLSPNIGPASPPLAAKTMPRTIDLSMQSTKPEPHQQQPRQGGGVTPLSAGHVDPETATSLQSRAGGGSTAGASNPATPHGSFGAPGAATATAKPPTNTVPTTITECLFYDDPTKKDGVVGNSFSASNGQALAAAAAALMLRGNVMAPTAASGVTNESYAAQAPVSTGSFAGIRPPFLGDASSADALPGGSFGHTRAAGGGGGGRLTPVTAGVTNSSLISLGDAPIGGRNGGSGRDEQEAGRGGTPAAIKGAADASGPGTPSPQMLLLPGVRTRGSCGNGGPGPLHHNDDEHSGDDNAGDDGRHDEEAHERELAWQLADRELRALKAELDEITFIVSTARSELLERLKELIQLGAIFLPHTRPDQVGLCLITMKMLRQYPEEVPVKEINTDWVPLLMTLLTSSRENLFCCESSYDDRGVGGGIEDGFRPAIDGAAGFLATFNNVVSEADMRDAEKRRQACDAGITKYLLDPLPPMPAPRRLHDIVIAPQPVRFTKAMLQEMARVGMDSDGLSFSFSCGSLGVLAGVLHYYGDFLKAKYRSEVAAVGGRAKDAGATVRDVLCRGGYNVLLRRIWIWGVTPESNKRKHSTRKMLQRTLAIGDDASSGTGSVGSHMTQDEHGHGVANTANIGGGFVRVVGKPFRGSEAFALYDAIAHYLRVLEELCTEHQGNNSIAPQAPVKRRSVLNAFRRNKDPEPAAAMAMGGPSAVNPMQNINSTTNHHTNATAANGHDGGAEDPLGMRELVPTFEVCVASNYYYKRMMDEARWPARSSTTTTTASPSTGAAAGTGAGIAGVGVNGVLRHPSSSNVHGAPSIQDAESTGTRKRRLFTRGKQPPPANGAKGQATAGGVSQQQQQLSHAHGGKAPQHVASPLELPYCGGEEMVKKEALQRKATKKFYGFLTDHYEEWRARHSEDKSTNAYAKRITISLN